MEKKKMFQWFIEELTPYEKHIHGIERNIFSKKTAYQQVDVLDIYTYGRSLILDGKIQSAQVDEFVYHEALVHPPMLAHPNPKRVLILGGGEGATLREVLKYRSVEKATMIDIDREVVEFCKEMFFEWHKGAFEDPRTELLFTDGRKYLEETKDTFDCVIIDLPEPIEEGPSYLLFTQQFYKMVKKILNPGGTVVVQGGNASFVFLSCYASVYKTLSSVFTNAVPYKIFVPSFLSDWGFILASDSINLNDISLTQITERIKERGLQDLRFYDEQTHVGMFALPKHLREALEVQGKLIRDEEPLYVYA